MPADQTIDYLEFPAADLDGIESFYTRVFGWRFTDYGPDYRAFTDDRLDGGFYRSDLVAHAGSGSVLVVLYARDLEATLATVEHGGGRIVRPIFAFPGGRRFHFQDPHGNELAVWSDR